MVRIEPADLADLRVTTFIRAHLRDMHPTAPEESRHALDIEGLGQENTRVWVALDGDRVVGSVALAWVDQRHEELKSMRTDPARRGEGVASALLDHALADARARGVARVSLETGSMEFFAPARSLYRSFGFCDCSPFGGYQADPNSVFMTLSP